MSKCVVWFGADLPTNEPTHLYRKRVYDADSESENGKFFQATPCASLQIGTTKGIEVGNLALLPNTAFGESEKIEFLKGANDDESTSNKSAADGAKDAGRQNTEASGRTAEGNATPAPAPEGLPGGGAADALSSRN